MKRIWALFHNLVQYYSIILWALFIDCSYPLISWRGLNIDLVVFVFISYRVNALSFFRFRVYGSAKLIPFYYVVTLWLPAQASKGDPLSFPAVSVIEVAFLSSSYQSTFRRSELFLVKSSSKKGEINLRCATPGNSSSNFFALSFQWWGRKEREVGLSFSREILRFPLSSRYSAPFWLCLWFTNIKPN